MVTGSAGHLGEGLARTLVSAGCDVVGIDVLASPFTTVVASVADREAVRGRLAGVSTVFHAATLHKPHLGSHDRQSFATTNVVGTLTLLEEAVRAGVRAFVFTSSTSTFGHAMRSPAGEPAVWVSESLAAVPRNIYGVTKTAAEGLCQIVHHDHDLPVVVLRTARFFPEEDDSDDVRAGYEDTNVKANEYLYRRVDLQDVVDAHLLAAQKAPILGFGRYIISATTPFTPQDTKELGRDARAVVRRLFPDFEDEYNRRGWSMFARVDRVYDNARAREDLGWAPRYDYRYVLDSLKADRDHRSDLARAVGAKGYHDVTVAPYTRR